MAFKLPLSVPLRFLSIILHIVITSIILMYRQWNVKGCSFISNEEDLKLKDDQFIIALSFIIGFTSFEVISLIFGLSLYSNLQNFLSASFHFSGFVASLFLLFGRSCSDLIWIIFGVCCFVPLTTEIVTIFRICFDLKNTNNFEIKNFKINPTKNQFINLNINSLN
ncbi:transmembrane protein -like [Brachionus plicatilis]|uniref:Transmembrane protein 107 n=1 Tax=Brachionus plicatilis TaxID=10195 RepID=A0A3M7RRM4_BRAPC|nr:transmembrane protein -like [Brachionus plicatilis]